ncbi:MAG TPA: hypothetical protein ENK11_03040 [Phycisphaerales bacterium]|nr:hypothetical protein [Phycisphaerales bacterium]
MNAPMRTDEHKSSAQADMIGPPTPTDAQTVNTTAEESAAVQPVVLQRSPDEPAAASRGGLLGMNRLEDIGGLSGILMAGGVLLMSVILLGRLRRGRRNRPSYTPTPREQIAAIRSRAADRAQTEAFKVEAHEFTRQLAAILDTKAARLEQLIRDADDRLARLAAAERPAPTIPRESPGARSIESPAPDEHERIYRLADAGMDAVEIARQTGKPTGQVELILALRA